MLADDTCIAEARCCVAVVGGGGGKCGGGGSNEAAGTGGGVLEGGVPVEETATSRLTYSEHVPMELRSRTCEFH